VKTQIYLIRHGETTWNRERRFQGHLGVPLSETGQAQARALAEWLAAQPVRFAALYASDLERAVETARAIGARLGLAPTPVPALREIHCGEWEGLAHDEIEARYPGQLRAWNDRVDQFTLPGGESVPDVQRRVLAFYEAQIRQHAGDAILIVSHGVALSALLAALHDWDLVEAWQSVRGSMSNTGVTILSRNQTTGTHQIEVFNSTAHLPS
jgi:broad specificity phosphatase PhoE